MPEWATLDSIRGCFEREKPEGSFTMKEYAARYGLPQKTASGQLARLVDDGRLCMKKIILAGKITNVFWIPAPVETKRDRRRKS